MKIVIALSMGRISPKLVKILESHGVPVYQETRSIPRKAGEPLYVEHEGVYVRSTTNVLRGKVIDTTSWIESQPRECWRTDERVIRAVEEHNSGVPPSDLKVVEIPDGVQWGIHESEDGREWIAEVHRTWS